MILLQQDELIPADCIVLQTESHAPGQCFINTSQLDGERNLKPKLAPSMIQDRLDDLVKDSPAGDRLFKLKYIAPCKDIYRFDGKLSYIKTQEETTLDLK